MRTKVVMYIELNDDIGLESLRKRAQNAFDKEYPYARMESVKVTYVGLDVRPNPSSTDTDG